MYSRHTQKIPVPSTFKQTFKYIHHNNATTESNTRRAPTNVFIPSCKHIVSELVFGCRRCNQARKVTYENKNVKYAHLFRGSTCSIFSSISIDLVPIELMSARANSTRKYNLLIVLCMLTHCLEVFLC